MTSRYKKILQRKRKEKNIERINPINSGKRKVLHRAARIFAPDIMQEVLYNRTENTVL